MSKTTLADLRFCLSRNRLLTLPSGEILYFPAGNWLNGCRTSRIRQFVLIDNLRIIAWQIILTALVVIISVLQPPLYWLGLVFLLPLIEIIAAWARQAWVKPVAIDYSYFAAIRAVYDRYPTIYKNHGFMFAPFGRRIPIVLMIFFTLGLLTLGGVSAVFQLVDLYCRFLGACRILQAQVDWDMVSLSAAMLFVGVLFVFNIRNEPVSLPMDLK